MLAEPGLVEAERVQVLDELQVALERQRRVLAHRVERGQEDAEPEAAVRVDACHGWALRSLIGFHGTQDLAVFARGAQRLEGAGAHRPGRRPT